MTNFYMFCITKTFLDKLCCIDNRHSFVTKIMPQIEELNCMNIRMWCTDELQKPLQMAAEIITQYFFILLELNENLSH